MRIVLMLFLLSAFTFDFQPVRSQTAPVNIQFILRYNNQILSLNQNAFQVNDSNTVKIDVFKFYISKIALIERKKIVFQEQRSFHLINASNQKSLEFSLVPDSKIDYDQIRFVFGIDSIDNVSGVMGGDMDPTNGMYWTWQSGYINCKLEGQSKRCNTRNHEFKFHLGGYQNPFKSYAEMEFQAIEKSKIVFEIDINKFLDQIDLSHQNMIMSPGDESVILSKKIAQCISIKTQ